MTNPVHQPTIADHLSVLRAKGWAVAVHNDYRLHGQAHTFYLLTHPNGRWAKGEGRTDAEALIEAARQIERYSLAEDKPGHFASKTEEGANGSGWVTLGFGTYTDAERWLRWMNRAP